MRISFGKHDGKSIEAMVLKEPAYVDWMLRSQNPSSHMAAACEEAQRLIGIFNAKRILRPCTSRDCGNAGARFSVYQENVDLVPWCAGCDPYDLGARSGKLAVIQSYDQAIQYVKSWCSARDGDMRKIIREMASAKGLPSRVGDTQAEEFFRVN